MRVKKNLFWVVLVVVALVIILVMALPYLKPKQDLSVFAKCLSDNGAVMYGAYWCSHCQAQKALFGDSFKFVNYVECTVDTEKCSNDGVKGFPTWIINSSHYEGEQSLSKLAGLTGCALPLK